MACASRHLAWVVLPGVHSLLFALCAVFSLPVSTFAADDYKTFSSFEIEVTSRTGFFPSPAYTVSIDTRGRVTYKGYKNVHWKGKRHARISKDAVAQLVEHIRASGYFELPSSYDNQPCLAVDRSEGGLRIRLDDHEKSVGTCGAPAIVDQLMAEVESATSVWRWVFYDPDELRMQIAHGWRISEHMPEFMQDAIEWNASEIIRILVNNGVDPNGLDSDKEHYLMYAVRNGCVVAARALLDAGADWKIEESYGNENPAINAGLRTPQMVKLFLEKGADINALSTGGHTMLMNAASQTNPSTVKFLIDAGADVNIRNNKGETALSVAEQSRNDYWHLSPESNQASQEIIEYLVAHGAVR